MYRPALSVVIPCYNEAACLELLHARVSAAATAAVGDDHEIVLIDDGSRDDSWAVMQRLAAADPRLVAINLSRNHGHQLALTAGWTCVRGSRSSSSTPICRTRRRFSAPAWSAGAKATRSFSPFARTARRGYSSERLTAPSTA